MAEEELAVGRGRGAGVYAEARWEGIGYPVGRVSGVDPESWGVCVCLATGRGPPGLNDDMAFYISQPKVRQAGFELPNKTDEERQPSPAYDPSMYFAHNNFGSPFDAFSNRPKYTDHSVDFADTLATMITESDARGTHYAPQPNPFDPHQFPHASSGHPILSPTGSAFGGFPASAPATSHPPYFDSPDYAFLRGTTDRADTPSLASPTADSPFSQTAPTAPSKRGSGSAASRSRSRGPAAASTSRTRGARKRQSISSPSPPPSSVIPSQNAWYIPSSTENPSFGFLGNTPSSLTMPSSIAGASPKSLAKGMPEDLATKQAQLLSEKRRRRRESHNAVERRRRDNINEKISELSTLIPDCLLTEVPAATKDDVLGPVDEEGTREGPKANKGMILRKSVDYIKYLQQLVRAQASRNRELESQLSQFRGDDASDESPNPSLLPLAAMDALPAVDLGNLLPIEDEDSLMSSSVALNPELSSQILANIEGASPSEDGDEEELRGRQAERQRRFASRASLSLSKSEMVEEVDESALSDGSGKMED